MLASRPCVHEGSLPDQETRQSEFNRCIALHPGKLRIQMAAFLLRLTIVLDRCDLDRPSGKNARRIDPRLGIFNGLDNSVQLCQWRQ